ncbi:MAG: helix-turn-helix transcriptional regulator [Candidatus Hydrogenedentales bacterium]
MDFDQPDEWKTKAHIAAHVLREIEERGLTQAKAAKLLKISQPEVSNLKNGQLDRFTIDRLFRFSRALEQHVHISIVPQTKAATNEAVTINSPS